MTAVSGETVPAPLELRSAALPLVALVLPSPDLEALAAELAARAEVAPGLFDDEPVLVDLARLRETDALPDFDALLALLRRHGMVPLAARGGSPTQLAAAREAGLIEAPGAGRPPAPTLTERIVEVQRPPLPPLIVDRPLRSGQQVYARERDLIVLALVSHGAEVIADGHIHVYAPLRGRALAGAAGNTEARIFSTEMDPQLLSIAGYYRTIDEPLPAGVSGRPAMARLADGALHVDPLSTRP